MSNYVIAIGGTGARFMEALIHLAATGILSQGEGISALIIDPDNANGNIERVEQIHERYKECNRIFSHHDDPPVFGTRISYSKWSPVGDRESLNNYLGFSGMDDNLQDICRLFYTKAEIQEEWDHGFRGRAHLGAPVMGNIDLNKPEWDAIITGIRDALQIGMQHIYCWQYLWCNRCIRLSQYRKDIKREVSL
ncbi:MAG: hypothetical protein ACE5EA_06345 [Nitrospirota bacterium]